MTDHETATEYGPVASLIMITDDGKAMETKTEARSPMYKRSDTNSFPKGFSLR